jgi:hypothetical protein
MDINEKDTGITAESGVDEYTHEFKKPFEYMGTSYKTLTFDWGSLTGRDSLAISSEMTALGKAVAITTFSPDYHIRLAARACTTPIGSDAFELMTLRDFNKITSAARNFLLV